MFNLPLLVARSGADAAAACANCGWSPPDNLVDRAGCGQLDQALLSDACIALPYVAQAGKIDRPKGFPCAIKIKIWCCSRVAQVRKRMNRNFTASTDADGIAARRVDVKNREAGGVGCPMPG
jgi:hypothetical protein